MADTQHTIFLLGATGYLGSQFLILLSNSSIRYHIAAFVRNTGPEIEAKLKNIYQDLSVIRGTLDDHDIIVEQAAKAKYVINCASSFHEKGIQSLLDGLEKLSANRPGDPPVFIHISGLGILNDNARGELVPEESIPKYTDIGFSLDQVPVGALRRNCDSLIVAAGVREHNPIRTIIAYPGWIFGVGEGIKKSMQAIDIFLDTWKTLKHAGTWGPGYNSMTNVHVKDAANAILMILEAAIAGKADEGSEGFYFIAGDEPNVTVRDLAGTIGDIMFSKGIYTKGGFEPLPPSVIDTFGEFFWRVFACNSRAIPERLKRLGWQATVTKKTPLLKILPQQLDVVLQGNHR